MLESTPFCWLCFVLFPMRLGVFRIPKQWYIIGLHNGQCHRRNRVSKAKDSLCQFPILQNSEKQSFPTWGHRILLVHANVKPITNPIAIDQLGWDEKEYKRCNYIDHWFSCYLSFIKLAQTSLHGISTQIVCIKSSGKINLTFEYDISLKGEIHLVTAVRDVHDQSSCNYWCKSSLFKNKSNV